MATTREMLDEAGLGCSADGPLVQVGRDAPGQSVQVGTDAYEDLRNATPEELLAAVTWFYRQESTTSAAEAEEIVSLLRIGWEIAQPDGWEHVAPMWLRESRKAGRDE